MDIKKYYVSVLSFQDNNSFQSEDETTGDILIVNTGDDTVILNSSLTLNSGQSFGVNAKSNERDYTKYNFFFTGLFPKKQLTFIIKKYI